MVLKKLLIVATNYTELHRFALINTNAFSEKNFATVIRLINRRGAAAIQFLLHRLRHLIVMLRKSFVLYHWLP